MKTKAKTKAASFRHDYFLCGQSISEIARRYGVSKQRVSGVIALAQSPRIERETREEKRKRLPLVIKNSDSLQEIAAALNITPENLARQFKPALLDAGWKFRRYVKKADFIASIEANAATARTQDELADLCSVGRDKFRTRFRAVYKQLSPETRRHVERLRHEKNSDRILKYKFLKSISSD